MPKDLLKFLFQDSFEPTGDEAIAGIFEKMSEIETIETRKGPLEKVLKDLGHSGDVCINSDGTAQICTSDFSTYSDLAKAINSPEGLFQLAELGWVPTFKNDDQDALSEPHYVISFICICEPTPSDGDKIEDLEKILTTMNEPNEDGSKGIGSDEKIPDLAKKIEVPASKDPKLSIRDSVAPRRKVKPGDQVVVGASSSDLVPDQPEKGTKGTVLEVYEDVLVVEFSDGKTFSFSSDEVDLP